MNEYSDIALLAPVGDIDISSAPLLREQLHELMRTEVHRVLINCQNVSFIDSTGLAILVVAAKRLRQAGGRLYLVNASAALMRFLQIAKLVDTLHVRAADKVPLPTLSPDALPLWSKTLSLAEGIEHVGEYRHRIAKMLESSGMSPDARWDLALAASEAIANAYDHACATAALTVRVYVDRVLIEVLDCGCGFELASDEEPTPTEERGRGIRLMRMLVDSVEVRRREDASGTLVRLIKLKTRE